MLFAQYYQNKVNSGFLDVLNNGKNHFLMLANIYCVYFQLSTKLW